MTLPITYLLNAFLLAVVFILLLEKVADRLGLVDIPDARKAHGHNVPLVGGLAIFGSFILATALLPEEWRPSWELVLGLSLLVAVGTFDDLYDLKPLTKLAIQISAAIILVVPGWSIIGDLGTILGDHHFELGILALPFTLFFVVGVVNALNMLDGLDGLTGGSAACTFIGMAAASTIRQNREVLVPLFVLTAATLGFLLFNFRHPWCRHARIFMGDAGSLMLGGAVAFFAIRLATHQVRPVPLGTLLWLFAIPLLDTISLMVRRMAARRNPFVGDRQHLHHLLLEAGLTPLQATNAILVVSMSLALVGLAGIWFKLPDALMAWGLILPAAAHTSFVFRHQIFHPRIRHGDLGRARTVKLVTPPEGQGV